ncbi:hypothetical protein O181_004812 [Austropuccinia psidii MF-1]|uniref:Lethal giant larvae (Lgl)-like C-terminal domain-containing protein n=1 Tax=Austropuccinia psidii MF-1 TaxID=1389203 RepID=A0A9Q3BH11_9BASI|nr:hypothetical protein [Austropuccinia psidii MF-1]
MEIFKSHHKKQFESIKKTFEELDWSQDLVNNASNLFLLNKPLQLGLPATISAIAYDPLQSLLAVGTVKGTIHIWGAPGVYLSWRNRPENAIKFLTFKPGSPLLSSIDVKDTLFTYDLSKIQDATPFRQHTHSVRSVVTCFATSPTHSHMFLGLKDGTVDCFDLEVGIVSPYRIRNLWLEHEGLCQHQKPPATGPRQVPMCTDIKLHPFDLNLILIAYEAGISLYDFKQRFVIRSFQLTIPVGAIGSNTNPNDPSVFEERKPSVNCICFRPDAQIFVSGHSDGCLAFWSLEDDRLPILVRTMDQENVLSFHSKQIHPQQSQSSTSSCWIREPIFRLAWNQSPPQNHSSSGQMLFSRDTSYQAQADDSNKHGSMLTILGGLLPNDPIGVHVFHFPLYNPSNHHPTGQPSIGIRNALQTSIHPVGHSVYLTDDIPQDFILMPKNNPHFDNSHDPFGIIISSTSSKENNWFDFAEPSGRNLRAYTFPPSIFKAPKEYLLPSSFDWIASKTVLICEMFELSKVGYQNLIGLQKLDATSSCPKDSSNAGPLPLTGGRAKVSPLISNSLEENHEESFSLVGEYSKKYRILATVHTDGTICFWDFTFALLLPKSHTSASNQSFHAKEHSQAHIYNTFDLKTYFPPKLHHLTINLSSLFETTFFTPLDFKISRPKNLKLNTESLDLLIIFGNGASIIYTFHRPDIAACSLAINDSHDSLFEFPSTDLASIESNRSPPDELSKAMNEAFVGLSLESFPSARPSTASCQSGFVDSISPEISQSNSLSRALKGRAEEQPMAQHNQNDPNGDRFQYTFVNLDPAFKSIEPCCGFRPTLLIRFPCKIDVNITDNAKIKSSSQPLCDIAFALEDLGFLAVAQRKQEVLRVFDLRNSKLLFDGAIHPQGELKDKSKSTQIQFMAWLVSRTSTDHVAIPRLLIGYERESFHVLNLRPSNLVSIDNWNAIPEPLEFFKHENRHQGSSSDHLISVFLFSSDGKPILPTLKCLRNALMQNFRSQAIFEDEVQPVRSSNELHSISIVVSSRTVILRLNINGPQLFKQTDISPDSIVEATIISLHHSRALLLIDQKRNCFILSLPQLKPIYRSSLPTSSGHTSLGTLSLDSSGDMIEYNGPADIHLVTVMFGRDLAYHPSIELYNASIHVPDHPQPQISVITSAANLATNLLSWFQSSNSNGADIRLNSQITGQELDQILAGPQRPKSKKKMPQPPHGALHRSTRFLPIRNHKSHKKDVRDLADRSKSSVRKAPQGESLKTQLNQNIEGLDERADRLKYLNERFSEISETTNELVKQAKRISQQQAAKSTFSMGLSSAKSYFK